MPSRRQAREYALQMLYQAEVGGMPITDVLTHFWDREKAPEEVRSFAVHLADGVGLYLVGAALILGILAWMAGRRKWIASGVFSNSACSLLIWLWSSR